MPWIGLRLLVVFLVALVSWFYNVYISVFLKADWRSTTIFVDAQAGRKFVSSQQGCCPCITRSRGGTRGFYMIGKDRWMTIREIAALQGLPSWVVDRFLQKGVSETVLGRALGDAMSLHVLLRILPRALLTSGLLKVLPKDVWAEVATDGLRMPDELLRRRD